MSDISRNEVELEGLVLNAPVFSHENHNTRFYRFFMQIPRLSGQWDTLPVLIPEHMTPQVIPEQALRLQGQLRSFNNRSQQGRRLILSVHVQTLLPCQGEPCNHIRLSGRLCKPSVLRRTPLGRSICDLMLAVPRRYGRTDYLPVIVWGRLAMDAAALPVSAPVELEGRIQSRLYTKVTEEGSCERTAYEVSVMQFLEDEDE